ncbi:MAG TPA: hypothetical protein VJO33_04730 [Gemmatimonadaceae bacterium]|nr:hypothetical protein [Gemmatimonadaceae bacterium]
MENPIDGPPVESPPKTPLRVPAHGRGFLRSGGTSKRSGRPATDAFRRHIEQTLTSPATLAAVEDVLGNPRSPHFPHVLRLLLSYFLGRPPNETRVDLTVYRRPDMAAARAKIEAKLLLIEQRLRIADQLERESEVGPDRSAEHPHHFNGGRNA